jgi:sulfite exporter TauE/SafE
MLMGSLLVFGFLLGIRHALEADHIATVASLVSGHSSRRQMITQGLAWGVGHSLTLLLFGAAALWVDTLIPQHLASSLEMVVGAMMILLGIDVVRRALKSRFHLHSHRHEDGRMHLHIHGHTDVELQRHDGPDSHHHVHANTFPLRALLLGLIHGMAGSAALILLFVDSITSLSQGLLYIAIFSMGSILGMLLFSVIISIPLGLTAKKLTVFHHGLQVSIGLITCGIGLMLLSS